MPLHLHLEKTFGFEIVPPNLRETTLEFGHPWQASHGSATSEVFGGGEGDLWKLVDELTTVIELLIEHDIRCAEPTLIHDEVVNLRERLSKALLTKTTRDFAKVKDAHTFEKHTNAIILVPTDLNWYEAIPMAATNLLLVRKRRLGEEQKFTHVEAVRLLLTLLKAAGFKMVDPMFHNLSKFYFHLLVSNDLVKTAFWMNDRLSRPFQNARTNKHGDVRQLLWQKPGMIGAVGAFGMTREAARRYVEEFTRDGVTTAEFEAVTDTVARSFSVPPDYAAQLMVDPESVDMGI